MFGRSPQESVSCSLTGVLRDIPQDPRRSPQESVSCSYFMCDNYASQKNVALRRRAGVVALTDTFKRITHAGRSPQESVSCSKQKKGLRF